MHQLIYNMMNKELDSKLYVASLIGIVHFICQKQMTDLYDIFSGFLSII